MNLFYHSGACSLAVHIALAEAHIPYRLVTITREKRTGDGRDFLKINPKGYVPALEFDDGTTLSESLAILVYLADRSGTLLPSNGPERWQALEALSFMVTEIHGNFKPFWKKAPDAEKDKARASLVKHFAVIAEQLGEKRFLVGETMTIADPYLLVMLRWAATHQIEVPSRFIAYTAHMNRRPSVQQALMEEGLFASTNCRDE